MSRERWYPVSPTERNAIRVAFHIIGTWANIVAWSFVEWVGA